jgi:hypothetical protein
MVLEVGVARKHKCVSRALIPAAVLRIIGHLSRRNWPSYEEFGA